MNDTDKFLELVKSLADKFGIKYEIKILDEAPPVTFYDLYNAITGKVLLWKNEVGVSTPGEFPIWYFTVNRYDLLHNGFWKTMFRAYEEWGRSGRCTYHGSISYSLIGETEVPESVRIINRRNASDTNEELIKEFNLNDNIIDPKVIDVVSEGFATILKLSYKIISERRTHQQNHQ